MNKFEWVSDKRDHIWNKLPERSTKHSAGYDFFAPTVIIIEPHEQTKLMFTDIKVKLDKDKVLMLYPRSSLGMKGIALANTVGIIDADYYNNTKNEGNIGFSLVNNSDKQVIIQQGEKFMQGTNADGKPCCPKCGAVPTDSESYEEGKNKGEIVFYYRCKECGQTFRRVINVKDI